MIDKAFGSVLKHILLRRRADSKVISWKLAIGDRSYATTIFGEKARKIQELGIFAP